MPPSKHSGSSRSAHKDSDQIPSDQNYTLGGYSFRVERSSVPGSTNDKIEAICTDKDGKNARKSIQVPSSTQLSGWFVEANETEATVYAVIARKGMRYNAYPGDVIGNLQNIAFNRTYTRMGTGGSYATEVVIGWYTNILSISDTSEGCPYHVDGIWQSSGEIECNVDIGVSGWQDYEGKRYWYSMSYGIDQGKPSQYASAAEAVAAILPRIIGEGESEQIIVGRFAIDIEDAGGVGPGSDWIDPGDYDPDWEEGEPTHTLYVEVTGALSGRHNDPIVDPSYSYIPADKDTVKDYGCGGDGGHGGGGGAGASTVVVHKFATNQANSKEVTAIARRHGYGSGGGKGGKGGDGCILVYY